MNAMDRVGAFSGAAWFVLGNIGNTLGQDASLSENPTGREILDSYGRLAGDALRQIGMGVELLGVVAWVIFVAYVYSRTRAAGWLGIAALVGGTISIAVKFASFAPWITPYLLRDDMTPETARMFTTLNLVSFMIDILPAGIFVACGAAAAMITHSLGRVLGWAGVVVGAVNVVAAIVVGPRIEGVFSPTFLLAIVWILVVSLRWGFARNRTKVVVTAE
jgi:hypothetical protein